MDMKEIGYLVNSATTGKILNVSLYLTGTKTITLQAYKDNVTSDLEDHYTALLFMETLLKYGNLLVIIDKLSDDLLNYIIDVVIEEKVKQNNFSKWVKDQRIYGEVYITQKIDMKKLRTYEKYNVKTLVEELFHDFKFIIEEGDTQDILNGASRLRYFKTKLVEKELNGDL